MSVISLSSDDDEECQILDEHDDEEKKVDNEIVIVGEPVVSEVSIQTSLSHVVSPNHVEYEEDPLADTNNTAVIPSENNCDEIDCSKISFRDAVSIIKEKPSNISRPVIIVNYNLDHKQEINNSRLCEQSGQEHLINSRNTMQSNTPLNKDKLHRIAKCLYTIVSGKQNAGHVLQNNDKETSGIDKLTTINHETHSISNNIKQFGKKGNRRNNRKNETLLIDSDKLSDSETSVSKNKVKQRKQKNSRKKGQRRNNITHKKRTSAINENIPQTNEQLEINVSLSNCHSPLKDTDLKEKNNVDSTNLELLNNIVKRIACNEEPNGGKEVKRRKKKVSKQKNLPSKENIQSFNNKLKFFFDKDKGAVSVTIISPKLATSSKQRIQNPIETSESILGNGSNNESCLQSNKTIYNKGNKKCPSVEASKTTLPNDSSKKEHCLEIIHKEGNKKNPHMGASKTGRNEGSKNKTCLVSLHREESANEPGLGIVLIDSCSRINDEKFVFDQDKETLSVPIISPKPATSSKQMNTNNIDTSDIIIGAGSNISNKTDEKFVFDKDEEALSVPIISPQPATSSKQMNKNNIDTTDIIIGAVSNSGPILQSNKTDEKFVFDKDEEALSVPIIFPKPATSSKQMNKNNIDTSEIIIGTGSNSGPILQSNNTDKKFVFDKDEEALSVTIISPKPAISKQRNKNNIDTSDIIIGARSNSGPILQSNKTDEKFVFDKDKEALSAPIISPKPATSSKQMNKNNIDTSEIIIGDGSNSGPILQSNNTDEKFVFDKDEEALSVPIISPQPATSSKQRNKNNIDTSEIVIGDDSNNGPILQYNKTIHSIEIKKNPRVRANKSTQNKGSKNNPCLKTLLNEQIIKNPFTGVSKIAQNEESENEPYLGIVLTDRCVRNKDNSKTDIMVSSPSIDATRPVGMEKDCIVHSALNEYAENEPFSNLSIEHITNIASSDLVKLKSEFVENYSHIFDENSHKRCKEMGDFLLSAMKEVCRYKLSKFAIEQDRFTSEKHRSNEMRESKESYESQMKQYSESFEKLFNDFYERISHVARSQQKNMFIALFLKSFLRATSISPELLESLMDAKKVFVALIPKRIYDLPLLPPVFSCNDLTFAMNCYLLLKFMENIDDDIVQPHVCLNNDDEDINNNMEHPENIPPSTIVDKEENLKQPDSNLISARKIVDIPPKITIRDHPPLIKEDELHTQLHLSNSTHAEISSSDGVFTNITTITPGGTNPSSSAILDKIGAKRKLPISLYAGSKVSRTEDINSTVSSKDLINKQSALVASNLVFQSNVQKGQHNQDLASKPHAPMVSNENKVCHQSVESPTRVIAHNNLRSDNDSAGHVIPNACNRRTLATSQENGSINPSPSTVKDQTCVKRTTQISFDTDNNDSIRNNINAVPNTNVINNRNVLLASNPVNHNNMRRVGLPHNQHLASQPHAIQVCHPSVDNYGRQGTPTAVNAYKDIRIVDSSADKVAIRTATCTQSFASAQENRRFNSLTSLICHQSGGKRTTPISFDAGNKDKIRPDNIKNTVSIKDIINKQSSVSVFDKNMQQASLNQHFGSQLRHAAVSSNTNQVYDPGFNNYVKQKIPQYTQNRYISIYPINNVKSNLNNRTPTTYSQYRNNHPPYPGHPYYPNRPSYAQYPYPTILYPRPPPSYTVTSKTQVDSYSQESQCQGIITNDTSHQHNRQTAPSSSYFLIPQNDFVTVMPTPSTSLPNYGLQSSKKVAISSQNTSIAVNNFNNYEVPKKLD